MILSKSGKNELIFGFSRWPCKRFTTARDADILVERDEFSNLCSRVIVDLKKKNSNNKSTCALELELRDFEGGGAGRGEAYTYMDYWLHGL